jgi:hypothetical protein
MVTAVLLRWMDISKYAYLTFQEKFNAKFMTFQSVFSHTTGVYPTIYFHGADIACEQTGILLQQRSPLG